MIGIYKIQSIINSSCFYIGSSVNIHKRHLTHKSLLRNNKHKNARLQNHVNKYGIDDLLFSVILECKVEELIIKEQMFFDKLSPTFNLRMIADRKIGVKASEETKKKIGDAHRGKIVSDETKRRISLAKKGKPIPHLIGMVFTQEMRDKISKANTGRVVSKETRCKISKAGMGRKFSKECVRLRANKVRGMKMTNHQKNKLSKAKNKPVIQYDLNMVCIKEWESMTKASEGLGISVSSVSSCTTGRVKSVKGFTFRKKIINIAKPLL